MSDRAIEFFIPGEPKGQPRGRATVVHGADGKPKGKVYDPKEGGHAHFKDGLWLQAKPLAPPSPWTGPVRYSALMVMTRPQGHWGTGRNEGTLRPSAPPWFACQLPDNDNNEKMIWDVCKTLRYYLDDKQIVDNRTVKIWQRDYEDQPGCRIRFETDLMIECPNCSGGGDVISSRFFKDLCPKCLGKGVILG